MRVLATNSHPDRSEAFMFAAFRNAGIDIEVLCDPEARRAGELEDAGIALTKLRYRSRADLAAVRLIRRKIRETRPDIVHSFNKRSLFHVMLASYGLNVRLVTYRGIIGNLSRWNPETRLTFLSSRLSRVICVCNAVREYMLSIGVPPERAVTILKGHDPSWYKKPDPDILRQYGIPAGAFVIGCAARMRARKGINVLIEAFAGMKYPGAHLILAGEINDRDILNLINAQKDPSRIHATGWISDAPAVMGACDVFVMPSLRREGLPRAVIEAMAQGVPSIVTNVGGMPEIVEHNVNGMIISPGDAAGLSGMLDGVASDPALRRTLGEKARADIAARFSINTTVDKTLQVYRSIAGG